MKNATHQTVKANHSPSSNDQKLRIARFDVVSTFRRFGDA